MSLLLLLSVLVTIIILLVLFVKLGDSDKTEHWVLQFLVLGFIVGLVIIVGKIGLDSNQICNWNMNDTSTVNNYTFGCYNSTGHLIYNLSNCTANAEPLLLNSYTNYSITYDCETSSSQTGFTFYKTILWFVRVVAAYIIIFFIVEIYRFFWLKNRRKNDRSEET